MRITRYTDYSLRVLIYLALKGEALSTINEIAQAYSISRNHLMKVVHQLASNGYIHSVRGKNGGMRLQKKAENINIGEIVRNTESDQDLVECFGNTNQCIITPACSLKSALYNAQEAFYCTLDNYTLKDLIPDKNRDELQQLLNVIA